MSLVPCQRWDESGSRRRLRRPAVLAATVALAATVFEPAPNPSDGQGFSAPTRNMAERFQPSGLGQWRRSYEVLHGLGARLRPPRRAYSTLDQDTFQGLDIKALVDELTAEAWDSESLLVKAMRDIGATDVSAWTDRQGKRRLSFGMDMGIPWNNVASVESWGQQGNELEEDAEDHGGADDKHLVHGMVGSVMVHQDTVTVDLTFSVNQPVIRRMLPRLRLRLHPGSEAVKVWIGGFIEWTKPCHFLIRKPMDIGFLSGLRRYSQAILVELRKRTSAKQSPASSDGLPSDVSAAGSNDRIKQSWWRRLLGAVLRRGAA